MRARAKPYSKPRFKTAISPAAPSLGCASNAGTPAASASGIGWSIPATPSSPGSAPWKFEGGLHGRKAGVQRRCASLKPSKINTAPTIFAGAFLAQAAQLGSSTDEILGLLVRRGAPRILRILGVDWLRAPGAHRRGRADLHRLHYHHLDLARRRRRHGRHHGHGGGDRGAADHLAAHLCLE